jgi:signal transduction histidine kinase
MQGLHDATAHQVVHMPGAMTHRPIVIVVVASLATFVVLVLAGRRVLERDREELYSRYASDQTLDVEEGAHELGAVLADLDEDLDLAATLLEHGGSPEAAERDLHAIATIKREYDVIDARTPDGTPTHVVAFDTPVGVDELTRDAMTAALDAADAAPGTLQVSKVLRRPGDASWFRVYARRSTVHPVTIGMVVDMKILLSRVKLPHDALSRVLVLGPDGLPTPSSDDALAALGPGSPVLAAVEQHQRTSRIAADVAASVGLPASPAVAVFIPVEPAREKPWGVFVISSTQPLDEQERLLVRRVLIGCALVAVLLISAAAYVIRNTRRAAMTRERLRNAVRLEQLTERAEKTVDHIPSGVLMLSSDRRITGANRWFRQRLDRDVTETKLDELLASGSADEAAAVRGVVDEALRTRQPQSVHRAGVSLFGEDVWLNVHAIPLERGTDDANMLLVFEDLTQVRRVEDRLLRSEKLVTAGQLAAGIAHEVGTPLNVARGRIEMAMSHLGSEHAEVANHRVAIDQIDRVTRLIQQLLDYVRPSPDAMQAIDPAATLSTVRDLLATRAAKRGVSLDVSSPPLLPAIRANPDQVQQVLVNLVLNALDACDRKGHVELSAVQREGVVVMEVKDDGQGIPRDIQAQVFDPFFTTKKRGQGTGLGLWVVAQIVRAHAGEIELVSAPEVGTRVRVAWPVTP